MKCSGLVDETVTIRIGGMAGQGISRSGMLLGRSFMRGGFHAFGSIDYPSLIRGGHNFYTVRGASRKVHTPSNSLELVVALNRETLLLHQGSVNPGGGVIYDEADGVTEEDLAREDITYFNVPMSEVVKELGGPRIMRNTVALGAVSALIGLELGVLKQIVTETFAGREKIIEMNIGAIQKGWEYVIEFDYSFQCGMEGGVAPERMWLTGNEAVALGAMAAGCNFYSAYPMTPASPVLHYFADHDAETNSVVIQAESELSAMNMVVGASYAGVRAMTSTSGGGFCLMSEALSMAAIQENPVVVMLGQRPGPSTGLATYSAQGDLFFSIYGGHGEFQRIVFAPGDVEECFYMTGEAFNMAERFQIPVILLTDKEILESHETVDKFDALRVGIHRGDLLREWGEGEYLRYKFTETGVSPRVVLGTENAIVLANSNEHTERGFSTSVPEATKNMVDKRFQKEDEIREATKKLGPYKFYGSDKPDVTIVGWGSTKGAALEAIRLLADENIWSRYLQVRIMEPFPVELGREMKGKTLLIENNRTGQLGKLIRFHTGHRFDKVGLRYDGRAMTVPEIVAYAEEVLK